MRHLPRTVDRDGRSSVPYVQGSKAGADSSRGRAATGPQPHFPYRHTPNAGGVSPDPWTHALPCGEPVRPPIAGRSLQIPWPATGGPAKHWPHHVFPDAAPIQCRSHTGPIRVRCHPKQPATKLGGGGGSTHLGSALLGHASQPCPSPSQSSRHAHAGRVACRAQERTTASTTDPAREEPCQEAFTHGPVALAAMRKSGS